ncbi:MAG TPA: methyltransferase [Ktedonobacterales bacterium]|nr:methyltransferase [Ktedonobacterales bacterium]
MAPTPAVFAGGRLDAATALLAGALELSRDDVVANLGCSAGMLGLVAARHFVAGATERLTPDGRFYLVANRFLT